MVWGMPTRGACWTRYGPVKPVGTSRPRGSPARACGAGGSTAVVDGLHVVAVQVAQEDAVVPRVVLGTLPRGVQDLPAGRHGSRVHRVDGLAVGCSEGHVQLTGLRAQGRAQPELRH